MPRKRKMYLLSRKERRQLKKYIRPSKSTLVFFVRKKDGKKRMVQNYKYSNKWIIKNNYLLLLISNIVENIGIKKELIKLNLQWRYNNIWIKERDE